MIREWTFVVRLLVGILAASFIFTGALYLVVGGYPSTWLPWSASARLLAEPDDFKHGLVGLVLLAIGGLLVTLLWSDIGRIKSRR